MRLSGIVLLLFGSQAIAGEDWQMIWVTHDAGWEINLGHGVLQRKGNVLEGTLIASDDGRPDYAIHVEIAGAKATGTFRVVSENDGAAKLGGSYKKWAQSARHCPEQIQLVDEHEYVGLTRDACAP